MCILFSYLNKIKTPCKFNLILLNNRDEFLHRPSNTATFVNDHNIYATDLTKGREGGTWLGLSKKGKIGVLLNLNSKEFPNDANKLGRGPLVPNFLNGNESAFKYAENLLLNSSKYNPFNLLLYEKNSDNLWDAVMFNNYNSSIKPFQEKFISLSNHLYDNPYKKTTRGEAAFEKIISTYNDTSKKNELVDKLVEFLKDNEKSEDCSTSTYDDDETDVRDRIFVNFENYATRTHTIILVDDKNKVSYVEHTLNLDEVTKKREWSSSIQEFSLL